MKINYILNARIPTEKANGFSTTKMCELFGKMGHEVELWLPEKNNSIKEDLFSYYNLEKNFSVKYVKCFDFLKYARIFGPAGFYLQSIWYLVKLARQKVDKEALVYTKMPEIAWLFKKRGYRVAYECHVWFSEKRKRLLLRLVRRSDYLVVLNNYIKQKFIDHGYRHPILVAPSAVNFETFDIQATKTEALAKLNFVGSSLINKKILLYAGSFTAMGSRKGIDDILEALKILNNKELIFMAVGGSQADIGFYKQKALELGINNEVVLVPHIKQTELALCQKAADILLMPLPNSAHYRNDTSPLKMFEYMASKRPIIASDLPSVRELLNEKNALFCQPNNADDLAKKINLLLNDQKFGETLSEQAYLDVKDYTWDKRAEKISKLLVFNKKGEKFWDDYTDQKGATYFPKEYFEKYAQGKILDIGCGDGTHADQASRFGEVSAFDFSPAVIERAKIKFPKINFFQASAYNIPFEDKYFDFIYSIDVIEHLDEPEKMIKEAVRLLKPNGTLVIQTPNYPIKRFYDLFHAVRSSGGRVDFRDDPTHVSKFNFWKLDKLSKNHFATIRIEARNILFENKLNFLKKLKTCFIGRLIGQKIIMVAKKI